MRRISSILVPLLVSTVYLPWLSTFKTLAGGDWPYLFPETIKQFSFTADPSFLWLGPYYQWTSKIFVQYLHLPWELTERFWWFWMFLVLSFFSSWFLSKTILGKSPFGFLTVLMFLTNTYILMIVGGGQMGVALAYALAPLVLALFIQFSKTPSAKNLIYAGFTLAFQLMFDPRISYVTVIAVLLYMIITLYGEKEYKKKFFSFIQYCIGTGILILIINSPWIIPQLFHPHVETSLVGPSSSLDFFSFGSFSQAISLLHPNWPENIFGKTYFFKPEFLTLPLIAFSSLLFVKKERKEIKKEVLFFVFLGLMGAFLSKGTQEPFSQVYQLAFFHIPGFFLFRDPTKFYLLVSLSYSIIIPYSLEHLSGRILRKEIILIFFIVLWGFLVRESLLEHLSGTFKPHTVPTEYASLKDFIIQDRQYSELVWFPVKSPFSFYSQTHPSVDALALFKNATPAAIPTIFSNDKTKILLKDLNVKYIIVPQDSEGKIFLNDRKYDEKEYQKTVSYLNDVSYLTFFQNFGKIVVFQVR